MQTEINVCSINNNIKFCVSLISITKRQIDRQISPPNNFLTSYIRALTSRFSLIILSDL